MSHRKTSKDEWQTKKNSWHVLMTTDLFLWYQINSLRNKGGKAKNPNEKNLKTQNILIISSSHFGVLLLGINPLEQNQSH